MIQNAMVDPIDLLAGLMFADTDVTPRSASGGVRRASYREAYEELDAGVQFTFPPMFPRRAHTFDMLDSRRVFTSHPDYLLQHPAETIGQESEVVIMKEDRVSWNGFRRIKKLPRRAWVARPRAVLYEHHCREVFHNGVSTYCRRAAAVDARGVALPSLIIRSHGDNSKASGESLVIAASIIEDCHRSGAIRCELTDHNTIVAPIPLGAQKELFALRDGPLTGSGRRRAILHHVVSHRRRSVAGNEHDVRDHFRGVTSFVVDGLRVTLTANDGGAQ